MVAYEPETVHNKDKRGPQSEASRCQRGNKDIGCPRIARKCSKVPKLLKSVQKSKKFPISPIITQNCLVPIKNKRLPQRESGRWPYVPKVPESSQKFPQKSAKTAQSALSAQNYLKCPKVPKVTKTTQSAQGTKTKKEQLELFGTPCSKRVFQLLPSLSVSLKLCVL